MDDKITGEFKVIDELEAEDNICDMNSKDINKIVSQELLSRYDYSWEILTEEEAKHL